MERVGGVAMGAAVLDDDTGTDRARACRHRVRGVGRHLVAPQSSLRFSTGREIVSARDVVAGKGLRR